MCIGTPWFTEHMPAHITLEYHKYTYSTQVALRFVVLYRSKPGRNHKVENKFETVSLRSGTTTKKYPVQKLDPNTLLIIPLQFAFKTSYGL